MKRKVITAAILLLVIAAGGCRSNGTFTLREGDLLFQDTDRGRLSEAIEAVTTGYQGMNITHIGIAAKDETNNLVVLEAASKGVQSTPLTVFLERSSDENNEPKVIVGRLKPQYRGLIPPAVKEAFALIGKPYDRVFAVDNGAYYCSELVYEIFLKAGKDAPVFNLRPMTFKDPATGQIHRIWENYFSEIGVPVPEGQPGINAGAMSKSSALRIVHSYGLLSSKCEKH